MLSTAQCKMSQEIRGHLEEMSYCSPATFDKSYRLSKVVQECRPFMHFSRLLHFADISELCESRRLAVLRNDFNANAEAPFFPPFCMFVKDVSHATNRSESHSLLRSHLNHMSAVSVDHPSLASSPITFLMIG